MELFSIRIRRTFQLVSTPIPRANTETDEGEHVPYTETNDSIKIGAAKAARKNKIE